MIGATQPAAVLGPRSLSPLTPRDRQSRRARSWTSEVFDRIAYAREHTPPDPPFARGGKEMASDPVFPPLRRAGRAPEGVGPKGGERGGVLWHRPSRVRNQSGIRARALLALIAFWACQQLLFSASPAWAQQGDRLPEGTVTEVRIEGNATIPSEKIRAKILSRVGQPLDQAKVETDLKSLMATKWFTDVTPYYEENATQERQVSPDLPGARDAGAARSSSSEDERRSRSSRSRRTPSSRSATAPTRPRPGSPSARSSGSIKRRATSWPRSGWWKGATPATPRSSSRSSRDPSTRSPAIDFKGNTFRLRRAALDQDRQPQADPGAFGGKYHRDMLEEDARKLREYYQSQGFFEVKVTPVTRPGDSLGDVNLTFVISEGTRYKVRNLVFEGNAKIKTNELREGLQLHSGKPFLDALREADLKLMMARYNALGCIKTQIDYEPKFTNQLGVVDLVYKIDEGEPFLVGELKIVGNTRTKDKVIRRESRDGGPAARRGPGQEPARNRPAAAAVAGLLPYEPRDGQADRDQDRQRAAQRQALRRPDDAPA